MADGVSALIADENEEGCKNGSLYNRGTSSFSSLCVARGRAQRPRDGLCVVYGPNPAGDRKQWSCSCHNPRIIAVKIHPAITKEKSSETRMISEDFCK